MAEALPGAAWPLGVTDHGDGTVNIAVTSAPAERVTFCRWTRERVEERYELTDREGDVFCGRVPLEVAQHYGLRVDGPWRPGEGLRCNPHKLLLDPYAREVAGDLALHDAVFGHRGGADRSGDPFADADVQDSAPFVPHAVLAQPLPVVEARERPQVPWSRTVVYEAHVRGLTRRHPSLPADLRGTYAGVAHPAVLDHLLGLGVTAVQLMPVAAFASEPHLQRRGLTNYWGYNSFAFAAPHPGYARVPGAQNTEFRAMVAALHAAGLEVWLDVVVNHTAEGDEYGPTLCWRGLDDRGSYRGRGAGRYDDVTGCGATLDLRRPAIVAQVLDALRWWVTRYGVDGFRFDLAVALSRGDDGFDATSRFLTAVRADPVLGAVKLIAEPWDVGPGGYQVGAFPPPWAEWNGRFRDDVRAALRPGGRVVDLGRCLTGSADVCGVRPTWASVNLITAHDGFTLADLVSYDGKHNAANGEDNRDGDDHGLSWNGGVEGPTDDPAVLAGRRARRRLALTLLLLSAGTPMITMGDELGRSQQGNNNGYCQDSPLTWLDWSSSQDPAGGDPGLLALVRTLVGLRAEHPALRRPDHVTGTPALDGGDPDVRWLSADGTALFDWREAVTLGLLIAGSRLRERRADGTVATDDTLLLWVHLGATGVDVAVPGTWQLCLDTASADPAGGAQVSGALSLAPTSAVLLRHLR